jgi:hypothetical protein
MAFVAGKQEVETFATEAAAQTLAYRVRFRGAHLRSQNLYSRVHETWVDFLREDAIAIVDDEAEGMIARQRVPELLQHPFRRGMGRGVVAEDLAGSDLYIDEDVDGTKGGGDHHREIAGHPRAEDIVEIW